MKTAELIHKYVPSVKIIGSYTRIDNFIDKTENQLREENLRRYHEENPII